MNTTIVAHAAIGRIKNPQLASRIDSALRLLEKGLLLPTEEPTEFIVTSERDSSVQYKVNGTCQCADFLTVDREGRSNAPNGWCKHRLAMALIVKEQAYQTFLIAQEAGL